MGSWNHTCFLSNLPVMAGDEVAVMILMDNEAQREFSNPITYWAPAPFMFYGKYDDYGGVEECHGSQMDYLIDEIRENILEDDGRTPDSDYNRGRVSRKGFCVAQLFEADHEEKLKLVSANGFRGALAGEKDPYLTATHIVILKSVLNKTLERYYWEEYEGDDKPNRKVNYEALCEMIPEYIETLKDHFENIITTTFTLQWHPIPDVEYDDKNNLSKHVFAYTKQGKEFYHTSFTDRIKKLTDDKKFDELEELLREFAKYIILYMFIRDARRCFIRASASSQDYETITQQMMAKITIEEGIEIDKRFADDDWDPKRKLFITQCEMEFGS